MWTLWTQGDLGREATCLKRDESEKGCLVIHRPTRAVPLPSNPAPTADRSGGGAGGAEPEESAGLGAPGPCARRSRLASLGLEGTIGL